MNILHVSSEVAPYSKTGGLGDVCSALPRAQATLGRTTGDRVAVVAPAYRVDPSRFHLARRLRKVLVSLGGQAHEVETLEGRLPGGGGEVRAFLIDHPCFHRAGLYGENGRDYPDNAFRFALLSRAALLASRSFGFPADVVHAHDWQAAPALLYARLGDAPDVRTVCTIHNLAFLGLFPIETARVLDLDAGGALLTPDGIEFYGQMSFLKAGLAFADRITTVSPRYAREIQTPEYGCGFDGYLRARSERVVGILNGAEYDVWNPQRDAFCAAPYDPDHLAGKRVCKAALQRELGLPQRPRAPLIGAVSRLTDQKGFDLAADVLARLLVEREVQVAVLGAGEAAIEERLRALATKHPLRIAVRFGYDERLAHRIYAGSDLFLMPSRWEPCGLGQMYALRYGAVPVVRATGGLDDTVVDFDARSQSGTGFKFTAPSVGALDSALRRALALYSNEEVFVSLVRRAMLQDFSWAAAARAYRALYEALIATGPRAGATSAP